MSMIRIRMKALMKRKFLTNSQNKTAISSLKLINHLQDAIK